MNSVKTSYVKAYFRPNKSKPLKDTVLRNVVMT